MRTPLVLEPDASEAEARAFWKSLATPGTGHHILRLPFDLQRFIDDAQFDKSFGEQPFIGGGAGPSAWALPTAAKTSLLDGTFAISNSWKVALFLSTSNIGSGSTTYAGLTNEVAAANGYSTGGNSATGALSGTTTVKAAFGTITFTASGGNIVARFAVIYKVSSNVLVYCTLDSAPADVTIYDGNSLALDIATNGAYTLA